MTSRKYKTVGYVGAIVAALAAQACGDGDSAAPVLRPGVVLIDRTTQPLRAGAIESVNGTYGPGCDGRSGAWSVAIDPAVVVANPLTVLQADGDCDLTLTEVVAVPVMDGDPVTYTAEPDITLQVNAYGPVATFTSVGAPTDTAFYGNARIIPVAPVAPETVPSFNIEFAFSEDPRFGEDVAVPVAETFDYTLSETGVPAPEYTINFAPDLVSDPQVIETPLQFYTVEGVTTVLGQAVLVNSVPPAGPVLTPVGYVLTAKPLTGASTFAEVHEAYTTGTAASIDAPITGAALTTLLAGPTPDATQATVIVAAASTENNVRTYQVITLTFGEAANICAIGEVIETDDCECVGDDREDVDGTCVAVANICAIGEVIETDDCECEGTELDNVNGTCVATPGNICQDNEAIAEEECECNDVGEDNRIVDGGFCVVLG